MQEIEAKVKQYFENFPCVITGYIFGSFAKQKANRFSDIDIAILLSSEVEKSCYINLRLKFMKDLSSVLEKETHVVVLNNASPFLRYQVFRYGKRILERDVKRSRSFKARAICEYFDFKPIKEFVERAKIELLKENSHG